MIETLEMGITSPKARVNSASAETGPPPITKTPSRRKKRPPDSKNSSGRKT
jgi:hypothetical protein